MENHVNDATEHTDVQSGGNDLKIAKVASRNVTVTPDLPCMES